MDPPANSSSTYPLYSTRGSQTIKNCIIEQVDKAYASLKAELNTTCLTITLLLNRWTSKNHYLILAIIRYWITPDFEYFKAMLKFKRPHSEHTSQNLMLVVLAAIQELNVKHKLIAVVSNSASNNRTLVNYL